MSDNRISDGAWLDAFADSDTVLIEGLSGTVVSKCLIEQRAAELASANPDRGLCFLLTEQNLVTAIDLHALLMAKIPVALLDGRAPINHVSSLIERYAPKLVLDAKATDGASIDASALQLSTFGFDQLETSEARFSQIWITSAVGISPHPDLSVLLTTSGSTGSPKFVRLSSTNITANAHQIASSIDLSRNDCGLTSLPMHYSFGMSILTSHAIAGSPVVVTSSSVLEPVFWEQILKHRVTILAGVPQTYQMLRRLGFEHKQLPSLRALLQAGGRLDTGTISEFAEMMTKRSGSFYVMYGQTEASPRMACLPPRDLKRKLGAAGKALSGARLEIKSPSGEVLPPNSSGEVFYTGPNVMMGYAESVNDLCLGDVQGDTLATGDLGYVDEEGFLFLTGRSKRIAKVAGLRISLDEVEQMATDLNPIAVEAPPGTIALVTLSEDTDRTFRQSSKSLARKLQIPPKSVTIRTINEIPLLPSGKIDYQGITTLILESP